jgi:GNAT superfamily N-acetyltransferase
VEGQHPSEFFRWKHMASPFGRSILLVAEQDGEVIGLEGWMRWRVTAAGRIFEALRAVDLAVAPEHRGKGVQKALLRQSTDHFPEEAAFTFASPNEQSRPWTLKAGRLEVGRFSSFVRIGSPVRAGIRMSATTSAAARAEPGLDVAAERATEALDDGQGVSALLSEADELNGRLRTLKDLEYLRWRFGAISVYRAIRQERAGRLAGLAIFRVRRKGRLWTSTICELLVARGDHRLAGQLLRQVAEAAPVAYVSCHFPPRSTPRRAAFRCGFVPLPRGPVPTVRLLREDVAPDPVQQASWALCLGDLDLL